MMKGSILLSLFVLLPMILAAPTPDDEDAESDFGRVRRTPLMLPQYLMQYDDNDMDEDMMRKRRGSSAYLSPSSKFLMWRDPDEEEYDDEFGKKTVVG